MVKDIVPELLTNIEGDFQRRLRKNKKIERINAKIRDGSATYVEANEYAEEIGKMLAASFRSNLSSDVLPDGRMYYNIAERILNKTLGHNHELIADVSANIQTALNRDAKLRIKGQMPKLNQSRIDGLIERVSEAEQYDDVAWILDEPIINFSQSIVDGSINVNAEFHARSGLSPKIVRTTTGKCCDWCDEVAGTYDYPDVPKDVFRRHQYCNCIIEYVPGDGKRQNVHTKHWVEQGRADRIRMAEEHLAQRRNQRVIRGRA